MLFGTRNRHFVRFLRHNFCYRFSKIHEYILQFFISTTVVLIGCWNCALRWVPPQPRPPLAFLSGRRGWRRQFLTMIFKFLMQRLNNIYSLGKAIPNFKAIYSFRTNIRKFTVMLHNLAANLYLWEYDSVNFSAPLKRHCFKSYL